MLKLQPYCQSSVQRRINKKLSIRYYGPYKIAAKVGKVTYKLDLPPNSKVHPVFHVSLLKKTYGQHPIEADFPLDVGIEKSSFELEKFLLSRYNG